MPSLGMIYVGAGSSGGRLAIDNHAEFMLARDDSNVALNWCNAVHIYMEIFIMI
jgi:hypothetical protein